MILVEAALDVYTGPVPPNSLWHGERDVRDNFRIHDADLDPAVGSRRLFVVARNARVGFAKTLSAYDCREVADSFGRDAVRVASCTSASRCRPYIRRLQSYNP